MADRVFALGKESGFLGRKDDLGWDELGQHIKMYRYGLETFLEEYENSYVLYYLGNKCIYSREKGEETFRAVQILSQREKKMLS